MGQIQRVLSSFEQDLEKSAEKSLSGWRGFRLLRRNGKFV